MHEAATEREKPSAKLIELEGGGGGGGEEEGPKRGGKDSEDRRRKEKKSDGAESGLDLLSGRWRVYVAVGGEEVHEVYGCQREEEVFEHEERGEEPRACQDPSLPKRRHGEEKNT